MRSKQYASWTVSSEHFRFIIAYNFHSIAANKQTSAMHFNNHTCERIKLHLYLAVYCDAFHASWSWSWLMALVWHIDVSTASDCFNLFMNNSIRFRFCFVVKHYKIVQVCTLHRRLFAEKKPTRMKFYIQNSWFQRSDCCLTTVQKLSDSIFLFQFCI